MARIRTIKPEFPQSESMGRVSRDARLLFVLLWTFADDEGRGRGASRMLASTLFPFDDDAGSHIDCWLEELEREYCIHRYTIDGNTYFQILKWTAHQKIDKPTPSRFPASSGSISENLSERHVELLLYNVIERSGAAFGHKIIDVQRQVRIGSRYLDIVAKTSTSTFVIELKKTNIAKADLDQVCTYCELIGGGIPILVGPGISPQFNISKASECGAAIVTYDANLTLKLALPNTEIQECSITLSNVIERQPLDLGPRTMDLVPGTTLSGKPDANPPADKKPEPQKPNEHAEAAKRVLAFLNEKTGRRYEAKGVNLKFVVARLREGATEIECRQVIAKKTREWQSNPSMAEYLRPKTLFNETNFAQYKGELGAMEVVHG